MGNNYIEQDFLENEINHEQEVLLKMNILSGITEGVLAYCNQGGDDPLMEAKKLLSDLNEKVAQDAKKTKSRSMPYFSAYLKDVSMLIEKQIQTETFTIKTNDAWHLDSFNSMALWSSIVFGVLGQLCDDCIIENSKARLQDSNESKKVTVTFTMSEHQWTFHYTINEFDDESDESVKMVKVEFSDWVYAKNMQGTTKAVSKEEAESMEVNNDKHLRFLANISQLVVIDHHMSCKRKTDAPLIH